MSAEVREAGGSRFSRLIRPTDLGQLAGAFVVPLCKVTRAGLAFAPILTYLEHVATMLAESIT
jgi:hypothetical protein